MDFRQANFILEGVVEDLAGGFLRDAAAALTEAADSAREYARERAAKAPPKKKAAQGVPSTPSMAAAKPAYPEYKLRGPMPPKPTKEGIVGNYLKGVKDRAAMLGKNAIELGVAAAQGGEAGVVKAATSGKLKHPALKKKEEADEYISMKSVAHKPKDAGSKIPGTTKKVVKVRPGKLDKPQGSTLSFKSLMQQKIEAVKTKIRFLRRQAATGRS